ncbi:hypothetical protein PHYBLDRAFT_170193 [Phycomyces blakesleeanus NRRL 1555(-)]|uniref:C2H2-type zinc finger transcription factor n=1 Tax=Phycomyces blakesleeanus (strain ATCC 8743b / DSM 1359 / FGSC 10004 / NBRC 33097 / NRRL 1555) TaxID=763407 RepID=A0A167M1J7_PHYB8|nr:hypothetical protein PHYBLDRAFT_170193 [Phycomyces blakesleeanus NRRL 1555(-)]OAD71524.1 hypothetical protein PHYBLDRAFT_170193 [Phycomyces blakesleeanus NRRL 1555(-)]|eukprot:XP_018289564.1 hypothetical protein PHYBLDRAFT_170193 [Phycomyces blakesleeanus NRRL 1555(-)]
MQKNTRQETYKIVKTQPPKRQGEINFSINSGVFTCSEYEKEFKKPWLLKRHSKVYHISNQMPTNTVLDEPEQAELIVENTIPDVNAFDYLSDKDDSSSIGDEEDNIVDKKNNIIDNFFDIEMNCNPVFNAFSDMFSSAAADDEVSMTDDDSEIPEKQMLKKILLAINLIIKIQQETPIGRTFKLPHLDALLNYQARKKFKMPVFPSQRIPVPGSNGNAFAHINLLSDHLRFLIASPKKSKLISSMSDCTQTNRSVWNKYFYTSLLSNILFFYCFVPEIPHSIHFLVELFHTANKNIFARGYLVRAILIVCYGIEVAVTNLRVEQISHVDTTPVERDHYYSISSSLTRLSPAHGFLLFGVHPLKKSMPLSVLSSNVDCDAVFYKVRIVPIILFTDDTSGNRSKQYNPFESWKDGANGMSLLPAIVDDFKKLKKGVKMFSAEDNEHEKDFVKDLFYFCECHERRTREHYVLANSSSGKDTEIPNAPKIGMNMPANEISFRDCLTGHLLELQSFDPEKDTTVKILHMILLDVAKYMVIDLVKVVLKNDTATIARLSEFLTDYTQSTGLSRKFTQNLRHSSSFLSRDFKVLLQILPVILITEFSGNHELDLVIPCFVELGRLCSLVFVHQVTSDFDSYIIRVDNAVKHLIRALFDYDKGTNNELHKAYCTKPKVYYLTHLKEDIIRFGSALNYETEKGKQFNNHICKHLFHTNCQNTSRDVCLKFAKQVALQHVIDGLVSGSVVKFLSIVPRTDNDRNNNYAKAVMTDEHSDVATMNLVCKLDLHIFRNPLYIINLSKFGFYWFIFNNILFDE